MDPYAMNGAAGATGAAGAASKMRAPGASPAATSAPSGAPTDPDFWDWLHGIFQAQTGQQKQKQSDDDTAEETADTPTAVTGAY